MIFAAVLECLFATRGSVLIVASLSLEPVVLTAKQLFSDAVTTDGINTTSH